MFKHLGLVGYLNELPHGVQWKRHIDHIRARPGSTSAFGGEEGASSDDLGSLLRRPQLPLTLQKFQMSL